METKIQNPFHINSNGELKQCRAKHKCPFGGVTQHFADLKSGMAVLDDLNEQLSKSTGFGIAVSEQGHVLLDKQTQNTVITLHNVNLTIAKLETIKKKAREQIITKMEEYLESEGKITIQDEVGKFSYVSGSTVTKVDEEALQAAGLYEAYLKDQDVSDYIKQDFEYSEKEKKKYEFFKNYVEEKVIEFGFRHNKEGKLTVTAEGKKSLQYLRDFEQKLKEAQELQKELKQSLMETMKEKNVNRLQAGKAFIEFVPEHTRQVVNTEALKADGLYDTYSKEYNRAPSLRITYNKPKTA